MKKDDTYRFHMIYCENNSNPCHMRDKDHRYFYANAAMIDLLDLADEFNINGKLVTDISHEMSVFSEEIYKYDELVIVNKNKTSLLKTFNFGRGKIFRPYIFEIFPIINFNGDAVGTMAEARPCRFFSPLQYVDGGIPVPYNNLIKNDIFTDRELEVIFFICHGLSSKETGKRLGVSHRTVENRLCAIYQKINSHNVCQLREYCQDKGINANIPSKLLSPSIKFIE